MQLQLLQTAFGSGDVFSGSPWLASVSLFLLKNIYQMVKTTGKKFCAKAAIFLLTLYL
tara:strand:- start:1966 stop:2139 length:174 start_codon:yes stop_codon:yes gene_type:complete